MLDSIVRTLSKFFHSYDGRRMSDNFSGVIVLPDGRFEVDRDALHNSEAYKQQVRALHVIVESRLNKKVTD